MQYTERKQPDIRSSVVGALLAIACLLQVIAVDAQQNQWLHNPEKVFFALPGNDVYVNVAAKDVFYYSSFRSASILYRNGKTAKGLLNYNRFSGNFECLNEKGDTLPLAEPPTVRFVVIGADSFCFDREFLMLLKTTSNLKLAVSFGIEHLEDQPQAGLRFSSIETESDGFRGLFYSWKTYQTARLGHPSFAKTIQFYFGDRYNHFLPADRGNLMEMFPGYERQIRSFCKTRKIDFDSRQDLDTIVDFINSIRG
ncbi:MAG: hypothetical protein ACO1OO_04240 [Flavisolibacter sp.]